MGDSDETKDQAVKLIKDLNDISFGKIALVVLTAWLIIYLVQRLFPVFAQRGPSQARLHILNAVPIIRLATSIFVILWMVPIIFNVTFQNFLVLAGGASVAIGFAFKDFASSLIAGVVAIFERPYRPGDWVEIDGDYGEVKSVGMRSLSLVTPSDDVIIVPHKKLWDQNISNSNDGRRTLMTVTSFYLAPDHDAAKARDLLRVIAMTSPFLEYNKPVLVMLENQPWGTHYKVKAYPFDLRDQFFLISDITVRGKTALMEAGFQEVAVSVLSGDGRGV